MNVRTTPPMDKATFFRWLERQERRHDLVDGVPRMLPYVTRYHERIATNVVLLLGKVLDHRILGLPDELRSITATDLKSPDLHAPIREYAPVMVQSADLTIGTRGKKQDESIFSIVLQWNLRGSLNFLAEF